MIRRAPAPVLAVPDIPFPVPPRTAVVGVDFSASSVRAARAALDLLADGGTLHLVHVWARTVIDHPAMIAQDDDYERALPDRLAAVERALVDPARDVTIVSTWIGGDTAGQLVTFARTHAADFIAAGKRGHGLAERLLVGQVTTGLIRTAPCAVLVTPEPQGAERAVVELALRGTAERRDRAEWAELLDAFSRRNAGRRTVLEVDDPDFGAQAQETGYTFLGATYDRHDGRVSLMLGDPAGRLRHLTRMIDGATSLGVREDASGRDVALSVQRGDGQTLLTFQGDAP
jgi:nucleotide-binding universal stress UspA family protein